MKRLAYYIVGVVIATHLLTSCKEDTPLPYDGLTGITFQSVTPFTERILTSIIYPSQRDTNFVREYFFTYDDNPEAFHIFRAPVAALGYTIDFDRPVSVEVDPSTTLAADDYEIATDLCTISSGSAQAILNVKIKRPEKSNRNIEKLVIKLIPNDYFSYVNGDGQYFTFHVSNVNYKPRYWDYPASNNITLLENFGLYSNAKFDFIHQTLIATKGENKDFSKYADLNGFGTVLGDQKNDEVKGILVTAYEKYKEEGNASIIDPSTGNEITFGY